MNPNRDVIFECRGPVAPSILVVDATAGLYLDFSASPPAWRLPPPGGASALAPAAVAAAALPLEPGRPFRGQAGARVPASLLPPNRTILAFTVDARGVEDGGVADLST